MLKNWLNPHRKWLITSLIATLSALAPLAIWLWPNDPKQTISGRDNTITGNENSVKINTGNETNNKNEYNFNSSTTFYQYNYNSNGEKLRLIGSSEDGMAVSELPPGVYFYIDATELERSYKNINLIKVKQLATNGSHFQVLKNYNNELLIIGFTNTESLIRAKSISKDSPLTLIIYNSEISSASAAQIPTKYTDKIGIPLRSILEIRAEIPDFIKKVIYPGPKGKLTIKTTKVETDIRI